MSSWPPHGLRLRAPDVELRGLTEAWAEQLAEVVPDDLEHHPALAHHSPATDVLQAHWRNKGLWQPTDWVLELVVLHGGRPVGLQALEGKDFAAERVVDTHSWLVPSARGQGLGTRMRAAVLALAFEHLGAVAAVSEAWADNAASLGVSRRLGYEDTHVEDVAGRPMQHLRLTTWRSPWPVEVEGLAPCLPLLGIRSGAAASG